jgi:hypothetical protein
MPWIRGRAFGSRHPVPGSGRKRPRQRAVGRDQGMRGRGSAGSPRIHGMAGESARSP